MQRIAVNWRRWALRHALQRWIRLPCWIRSVHGMRFYLGDDLIADRVLMHVCDMAVSLYFPRAAQPPPGSLLLDIGAHQGFYAVEALRRYPDTRMIAVEPDPQSCRMLARNLAANGMQERVRILEVGIGDTAGEAFLEYSPQGSWGNRTLPLASGEVTSQHAGTRVRMLPLANVLDGQTPYLVKCSAEGAEFSLFPQMFALGVRPEWAVFLAHPHAGAADDLLARFVTEGYSVEDTDDPPLHARFHARRNPNPST
jgi:FkbM family methyltransferase